MHGLMRRLLTRYFNRKVLDRWRRAAAAADTAGLPQLRLQRDQARLLRFQLDRLIHEADSRLMRPRIGSRQFPKPLGTDWSWRPGLWRGPMPGRGVCPVARQDRLDGQTTIFHDCPQAEIGVRQVRNSDDRDLAPFGLALDVFDFRGSFLSVSVELPSGARTALCRQHMFRASVQSEQERPARIFARLNIQHGPNTEQVLRELPPGSEVSTVDFDLAHLELNERRVQKIWLDLILDQPAMNRVVIRDLTLCRYHRADL